MFSARRSRLSHNPLANPFSGGDVGYATLKSAMEDLVTYDITSAPQEGGTLKLETDDIEKTIGPYDYHIVNGGTVSSFTNADWFRAVDDRISLIAVKGNLTINSGVVFRPTNRRLFLAIYVTGNVVLNGVLSMAQRGGKTTSSQPSRVELVNRWYSMKAGDSATVYTTNEPLTAVYLTSGGAGGASRTVASGATGGGTGFAGTAATLPNFFDPIPSPGYDPQVEIQTGGGGSGGIWAQSAAPSAYTSGAGAAGSPFGGGSGGGAAEIVGGVWQGGENATANGGAGGAYSGAGNPSGSGNTFNGIGGVVILMATGTITGSGAIEATGCPSIDPYSTSGGGSGGGAVVLFSDGHSAVSASANGGNTSATQAPFYAGGAGGNGSVYRFDW